MNDYEIGKVVAVSGQEVLISLLDHDENNSEEKGVPEDMVVSIPNKEGPEQARIGQPGTFVTVGLPMGRLLCLVTEVQMKESKHTITMVKDAVAEDEYLLPEINRSLNTAIVGYLDPNRVFERGSNELPTVNAPVFAVSSNLMDQIYASFSEGDFSIGQLSLLPNQNAKISLDAFLSRHAAILGQTGGGKSWTVASIIQKISKFPQSTMVLFDLHGEYKPAFKDDVTVISATDLELPYWLMNSEELMDLMIDRTEAAAPNQIAKFRELLQEAKEGHQENQSLNIENINIDTPVFFDFDEIIRQLTTLDQEMVPGRGSSLKQGPLFGKFTRMLMRMASRRNDRRYDLIFNPKTYTTSASMEDLFRKLLGETKGERKKIIVVDLSPVPFDVRTSVISLILRCLFDFSYWYRALHETQYPISIFADEAHLYLKEDEVGPGSARTAAERIAKEGRKYGISLTVISQRPREVSPTILSQCSSFLCMRISNPDDQSYVRSLLPDSLRGITNIFSSLQRGEAILLGDSVIMPTRIKIHPPDPKPASDDVSFYEVWNQEPTDIEFGPILHAWRSQKIESGTEHD